MKTIHAIKGNPVHVNSRNTIKVGDAVKRSAYYRELEKEGAISFDEPKQEKPKAKQDKGEKDS